jgi:hypothetical protein
MEHSADPGGVLGRHASGTPSGTLAAFSRLKLCDALGPGSGAESAVLRGKASARGDCGRANSRGRPVDRCRSAGCWVAPWNSRHGPARDRPRCSTRRIRGSTNASAKAPDLAFLPKRCVACSKNGRDAESVSRSHQWNLLGETGKRGTRFLKTRAETASL